MPDLILVLNAGSSSLKFGVFACSETAVTEVARGKYSDLHGTPHFSTSTGTRNASGLSLETGSSLRHVLEHLTGWLASEGHMSSIVAAGHRIVHGGTKYHAPVRLTPDVLDELDALTPLAPLHQPASLEPVRVLRDVLTDILQIGCFDTAFHHHLGIEARSYALPIRYQTQGIRKFGFHGLSYQHVASELAAVCPQLKGKRTVVAHLGNGCSLCAMRDGTSVDTTMGYTPLDGLMMGTRSGSLDPGLLLHLIRELKMSPDAVEHLLYNQSGLLGVSGISADMHTLLDSSDPHALAAIDLFVYRAVAEAARMTAALEGLEVLVFTGGIGENSWQIRERICAKLAWLGVLLDHRANRAGAAIISKPESKVDVHVVAANEEIVIAQSVAGVLKIQGA